MLGRLRRGSPESDSADLWVVAGLGNPGPEYAATRHNVGYLVVDELLDRSSTKLKAGPSGRALVAQARIGTPPGARVVLMRSRSYMNESGRGVAAVLAYYKVTPERLVVVHDELDIGFGDLRLKLGGGDGGHNGLRSIRQALGTGDFYRVRVGIGRPPGRQDPADFVLRPFSAGERRDLGTHLQRATDSLESLITSGLTTTQNLYHQ